MLMDERYTAYLQSFAGDAPFPGGMAFPTALKQTGLDYSLESLDRIDLLLDQIRNRFKLDHVQFLAKQANQNFVYLLAFYVGRVVAQTARLTIKWQDYDEMVALWPASGEEFSRCFATSISCLLGGNTLFFPLSAILERLFEADGAAATSRSSVRASANAYCVNQDRELAFRRPLPEQLSQTPLPLKVIGNAMHLAGFLTAQLLWDVAGGNQVVPTLCSAMPNGQRVVSKLMFDTLQQAVENGFRYLKNNPERALQLVMVYDAWIKLAHGQVSALIIEVRTKYPSPFSITLALPYRPASKEHDFAVHRLKLVACRAEPAVQQVLLDHFFAAIHEHKMAADVWGRHLDESI